MPEFNDRNDQRRNSRRQGIRGVGIAELPVAGFAHEVSDSPIARSHKACPPNLRVTLRTLYRQLRMSSEHSLFCLPRIRPELHVRRSHCYFPISSSVRSVTGALADAE